jgi:hypothetical protein
MPDVPFDVSKPYAYFLKIDNVLRHWHIRQWQFPPVLCQNYRPIPFLGRFDQQFAKCEFATFMQIKLDF